MIEALDQFTCTLIVLSSGWRSINLFAGSSAEALVKHLTIDTQIVI